MSFFKRQSNIVLNNIVKKNIEFTTETANEAMTHGLWVGQHEKIIEIRDLIERRKGLTLPIFIMGETGTGKSLLAELFYHYSKLSHLPLLVIDSDHFILDELYHVKEATILIEKIESLSEGHQKGLIQFIDQLPPTSNIRFLTTSDETFEDLIRYKKVRQDLLHRLAILKINIPPLRQRMSDLPNLVKHHMRNHQHFFTIQDILKQHQYDWPGNIRELFYFLDLLESQKDIHLYDFNKIQDYLPKPLENVKNFHENLEYHIKQLFLAHEGGMMPTGLYPRIIKEVEKILIEQTLSVTDGNQIQASKILGLHRNTLRKKISELS